MKTLERRNLINFGGNREAVIIRDGEKCVTCHLTRQEHRIKYGRDITVDHIDGNGRYTAPEKQNNSLNNLQTLCLSCHGKKDGVRRSNSNITRGVTCYYDKSKNGWKLYVNREYRGIFKTKEEGNSKGLYYLANPNSYKKRVKTVKNLPVGLSYSNGRYFVMTYKDGKSIHHGSSNDKYTALKLYKKIYG